MTAVLIPSLLMVPVGVKGTSISMFRTSVTVSTSNGASEVVSSISATFFSASSATSSSSTALAVNAMQETDMTIAIMREVNFFKFFMVRSPFFLESSFLRQSIYYCLLLNNCSLNTSYVSPVVGQLLNSYNTG